jgi:hypothetical protein
VPKTMSAAHKLAAKGHTLLAKYHAAQEKAAKKPVGKKSAAKKPGASKSVSRSKPLK